MLYGHISGDRYTYKSKVVPKAASLVLEAELLQHFSLGLHSKLTSVLWGAQR